MKPDRHRFIGGSDARIILSPDEGALIQLWKENDCGENEKSSTDQGHSQIFDDAECRAPY
jgi:hypothetical protein